MLMVIFGAGASYDSCPSFPPDRLPRQDFALRPPLAKELFLPLPQFRGRSSQFGGRFQPLLSYLETQHDIETVLEGFREEAEHDEERRRQLWAIRYYLRDIVQDCENAWMGHANQFSCYKTLLDQIRPCPRVCFVTFNYDTLIERALKALDVPLGSMTDYVSHAKYSLMKLHGSIDWQFWLRKVTTSLRLNEQPQEVDLIRAAPMVSDSEIIEIKGIQPPQAMHEIMFFAPALAVPTVSKHTFVCPQKHVDELRRLIPQIRKIAIVGWRAAEQHFLNLLATGLKDPVQIIAACGSTDEAEATLGRLRAAGIKGNFQAAPGGFTDFVVNRRIEPLLAS
ncbi:MAG TPA: hypothetical protein VN841_06655 [Bryobacteraceae bacterium]|nr:hypothetical protein [Bryobacteraceae bacterium]